MSSFSETLLRTAKRRRGMQTLQGEIRVDDFFYQAFVNPVFLPPEASDDDPCCQPDWDSDKCAASPQIDNPFSFSKPNDGAKVAPPSHFNSHQIRSFSPRLFDDTQASVAAFQDVAILARQLPSARCTNKQLSSCPSTGSTSSPPIECSMGSQSPALFPETASLNDEMRNSEHTIIKDENRHTQSLLSVNSLIESSSSSSLPPAPKVSLKDAGRKSLKDLKEALSTFLEERIARQNCLMESDSSFPLSASESFAALRLALAPYETLFCQLDALAVASELYHNVNKKLLLIISERNSQLKPGDRPLSLKDLWKQRCLIRHLVTSNISQLFAKKNSSQNTVSSEDAVEGIRHTEESQRREYPPDAVSRKEFATRRIAREVWQPRDAKAYNQRRIRPGIPPSCQSVDELSSADMFKKEAEVPDISRVNDDLTTSLRPPTFSNLCIAFDNIQNLMLDLGSYKEAFDQVYHLKDGRRTSLNYAESLLVQAERLAQICDLKSDIVTLTADVNRCKEFQTRIRSEMSSLFSNKLDSKKEIEQNEKNPQTIETLKPLVLEYANLPFIFEEGETLNLNLKEAISWNIMVSAAVNSKDLEKCEALVEHHDSGHGALGLKGVAELRADIYAAHWFQRLERLVTGKKQLSVGLLAELLTGRGRELAIRFKSNAATIEFIEHCHLLKCWILKALKPPFVNLFSSSEQAELFPILALCQSCDCLFKDPPIDVIDVTITAKQEDSGDVSSNVQRLTEDQLDTFCVEYTATRINLPAYRVIDAFRQRMAKWRKRQRRATSGRGTANLSDAHATLNEAFFLKQFADINDRVAELQCAIDQHEAWLLAVDNFLNRARIAAAEVDVERATTELLRSLHDSTVVIKDVLRVLSCPASRPSITELTTLLAQQADSPIVDSERCRQLGQLHDQAERWRRRARDCCKAAGKKATLTERLKLQLLVEAKYFCIDVKAEEKLAGLFYLELWRKRLAALHWPIEESELCDLAELPKTKHFEHLLSSKKVVNMESPAFLSESPTLSEKPLKGLGLEESSSADGQSVVSDDIDESHSVETMSQKSPIMTSPYKGVEILGSNRSYAVTDNTNEAERGISPGATLLRTILASNSETEVIDKLLQIRNVWKANYTTLRKELPEPASWRLFLEEMSNCCPLKMHSIEAEVEAFLCKAESITELLKQMTGTIGLAQLRDLQAEVAECPLQVPLWRDTGAILIESTDIVEAEADKLMTASIVGPQQLLSLKEFLYSLPERCSVGDLQLNLDSLPNTAKLRERLRLAERWTLEHNSIATPGSHATLSDWDNHLIAARQLRLESPIVDKLHQDLEESKLWMQILIMCSQSGDSLIHSLPLDVAVCLTSRKYGLGKMFSPFYEISQEVTQFRDVYAPKAAELFAKSSAQFQKKTFFAGAMQDYGSDPLPSGVSREVSTPIEQIVNLTRSMISFLAELENLKFLVVPELRQELNFEIELRELHLKLVMSSRCAMPHTHCPLRPIKKNHNLQTAVETVQSCHWIATREDCRQLLRAVMTWKNNIELHSMPVVSDLGLIFEQRENINWNGLLLLIEELQQLFQKMSETHSLPPYSEILCDTARTWMDLELISLLENRLRLTDNWMSQAELLKQQSGLPNHKIKNSISILEWPTAVSETWDLWGLPTFHHALQLRLQSHNGVTVSPIAPLFDLESKWTTNWHTWLSQEKSDLVVDPNLPVILPQKKQLRAKVSSVALRKLLGSTLMSEFCVTRNLGLKLSDFLRDPHIHRITGQMKLPRSFHIYLDLNIEVTPSSSEFNEQSEKHISDDDMNFRKLILPSVKGRGGGLPLYPEDWDSVLHRLSQNELGTIVEEVSLPSMGNALSLLKECYGIYLESLTRALPGLPLSEDVTTAMKHLVYIPRQGALNEPSCPPRIAESVWPVNEVEKSSINEVLEIFEQLELLPFQVSLKHSLLRALCSTLEWCITARKIAVLNVRLIFRLFICHLQGNSYEQNDIIFQTQEEVLIQKAIKLKAEDPSDLQTESHLSWIIHSVLTSPIKPVLVESWTIKHEVVLPDMNSISSFPSSPTQQLGWILSVIDILTNDLAACGICCNSGGKRWAKCDDCGRWLHSECLGIPPIDDLTCLANYKLQCSICLLRLSSEDKIASYLIQSPWYKQWVKDTCSSSQTSKRMPSLKTFLQLLSNEPVIQVDAEVEFLTHRFSLLLFWLLDVSIVLLSSRGLLKSLELERIGTLGNSVDLEGTQSLPPASLSQSPLLSPFFENLSSITNSPNVIFDGNRRDSDNEAVITDDVLDGQNSAAKRMTRSETGSLKSKSARMLLGNKPQSSAIGTKIEELSMDEFLAKKSLPQVRSMQVKNAKRRGRPGKLKNAGKLSETDADDLLVLELENAAANNGLFTIKKPEGTFLDGDNAHSLVLTGKWFLSQPSDLDFEDEDALIDFCKEFLSRSVRIEPSKDGTSATQSTIDLITTATSIRTTLNSDGARSMAYQQQIDASQCSEGRIPISVLAKLLISGAFIGLNELPVMSALLRLLSQLHKFDDALSEVQLPSSGPYQCPLNSQPAVHIFNILENELLEPSEYPLVVYLYPEKTIKLLEEFAIRQSASRCFFVPAERAFSGHIRTFALHVQLTLELLCRYCPASTENNTSIARAILQLPPELTFNVCNNDGILALEYKSILQSIESLLPDHVAQLARALHELLAYQESAEELLAAVSIVSSKISLIVLEGIITTGRKLWKTWCNMWSKFRFDSHSLSSFKRKHLELANGGQPENRLNKRQKRIQTTTMATCDITIASKSSDFVHKLESLDLLLLKGQELQRGINAVCAIFKSVSPSDSLESPNLHALEKAIEIPDSLAPNVKSNKFISLDAIRKLLLECQNSCISFDNINLLQKQISSYEALEKRIPPTLTPHVLSWDAYQSVSSALEECPCFLGNSETQFKEASKLVVDWIDNARVITRQGSPTTEKTSRLAASTALRKSAASLVVDLSRTKLYSELRRLLRDLRQQRADNCATLSEADIPKNNNSGVPPNNPVWVSSYNDASNMMQFSTGTTPYAPLPTPINCIGHASQYDLRMPPNPEYLSQHMHMAANNLEVNSDLPRVQTSFHFPVFTLPTNNPYGFSGPTNFSLRHDDNFQNVEVANLTEAMTQPLPGDNL